MSQKYKHKKTITISLGTADRLLNAALAQMLEPYNLRVRTHRKGEEPKPRTEKLPADHELIKLLLAHLEDA
ncbi:hypothetical protein L2735_14090 [Shewanella olleyana]|uniref:hypothetical protein n=1 Tax=Shewanella olleyana TaxID=135626 RepID=UPI00200C9C7D|nr:hypothetical protein [Shewanella olleyana]MCL1067921.1 hypothetical protein [Shewanella olleyana]